MKMNKLKLLAFVVLGSLQLANAQKAPQLGKASVDEVIQAMTPE